MLFIFDHVLFHGSRGTIGTAWEDLTAHIAYWIAAAAAVSGPDGQLAELLPNYVLPSIESARGNAYDLHVKHILILQIRMFSKYELIINFHR